MFLGGFDTASMSFFYAHDTLTCSALDTSSSARRVRDILLMVRGGDSWLCLGLSSQVLSKS